jgi:hypothetical protein
MRLRAVSAVASALAVGAGAVALALSTDASIPPSQSGIGAGVDRATRASSLPPGFRAAREDCSRRSEANFPGAFTSPRNLVVGPLVLIGGAYTDPSTAREFGGNKFPLLVKAGHSVTVRLARPGRQSFALGYGPLPQRRQLKPRDGYDSVTFVACRAGKPTQRYSPNGPSGSYADGVAVTFWSGFVLTSAPACIALDIYVDNARSPQRVGLALGRPCAR